MFSHYIIHSQSLNKFYTGLTSLLVSERLTYLSEHKGFTSKAKDSKIIHAEEFATKMETGKKEKEIKKRGACIYLNELMSG